MPGCSAFCVNVPIQIADATHTLAIPLSRRTHMYCRLTMPSVTLPFELATRHVAGIWPPRLFALKFSTRACARVAQLGGSVPVRLLLLRSTVRRLVVLPQVDGIVPETRATLLADVALHQTTPQMNAFAFDKGSATQSHAIIPALRLAEARITSMPARS